MVLLRVSHQLHLYILKEIHDKLTCYGVRCLEMKRISVQVGSRIRGSEEQRTFCLLIPFDSFGRVSTI